MSLQTATTSVLARLEISLSALTPTNTYQDARIVFKNPTDDSVIDSITVPVADSPQTRYTGLSNQSTPPDTGLLFIHPVEKQHHYVMRNMSFPIDIIYITGDGDLTELYRECDPDSYSNLISHEQYSGHGKYVLETPTGYIDRVGVTKDTIAAITLH